MVHKLSLADQCADALARKPINLVGICTSLKTSDIAQAQRQDPELAKVAECLKGPPQKLHSDRGRNFESRILAELCVDFSVKKLRTTP